VSPRVWHLVLIYLGLTAGSYTLTLWGPQLVKSLSSLYSNSFVGLLVMIPSMTGLVAMIFVARSSDRMMERRYHVAIPAVLGAAALFLLSTASATVLLHCPVVSPGDWRLQLLWPLLVNTQRISNGIFGGRRNCL
jgi:predicted MFS family arabinose efflux permease